MLLGLLVGGIPVGDRCSMAIAGASGCHATDGPGITPIADAGPTDRHCCTPPEPEPARPFAPNPSLPGAEGPCRARTASCCCVVGATQAVAERSSRAGASHQVSRAAPVAPPHLASGGPGRQTAARPSPMAPSKVPLYLRTARLRN